MVEVWQENHYLGQELIEEDGNKVDKGQHLETEEEGLYEL